MSIVLYRVDDRLIHGQVTVGWGRALQPDTIILVDDEVASNPWEEKLFQSSAPEPLKVSVWSSDVAVKEVQAVQSSEGVAFLLTRDLKTLVGLIERGVEIPSVNLGGLHFSPDKVQVLPYLSFSKEDIGMLRFLREREIEIDVRDLPTAEKKDVFDLLKAKGLLSH